MDRINFYRQCYKSQCSTCTQKQLCEKEEIIVESKEPVVVKKEAIQSKL